MDVAFPACAGKALQAREGRWEVGLMVTATGMEWRARERRVAPLFAPCLFVLLGALAVGLTGHAQAAELLVTVIGARGPVEGAVVTLQPRGDQAAVQGSDVAVMDQRRSRFVPDLLVVQRGTEVTFPNSDSIRHNVYSFSPAKTFQLPLYRGSPRASVRFDTPGVVAVGCNIHDWMVAHIVVVDTPYSAITDSAGRASLEAPPGRYGLQAWHAAIGAGMGSGKREISIDTGRTEQVIRLPEAPLPDGPRGRDPGA